MKRNQRPMLAVVLLLALAATATVAHAASLPIDAASLTSFSAGHPCPGTLTATTPTTTGTVSTVEVTPPAACAGRTITVAVNDGAVVRQGTATAPASGAVTVTLNGAYTPSPTPTTTVAATVSGWHLDTTWSYTPPVPPAAEPIVPGNPQTVITSITWTLPGPNQACAQVTITSTENNAWWRVNINTDEAPFYGATSGYQLTEGNNQLSFDPSSGTPVNGVLGIRSTNPGHGRLSPGSTRTFTVCNYQLPNPPDVPSAYTVSYAQGTWTDTQACVRATITGNGSSYFHFGWRAPIDMTPAFARIQSTGREVGAVRPETGSWDTGIVAFTPTLSPSTTSYQAANGWQGVLRLSQSRTVGLCASEY